MGFLNELKRRNVPRVAAVYIVTAWLIVQVADTVLPSFGLEHVTRYVIITLAALFIPAMILSFVFELTPTGFQRDDGVDDPEFSPKVARGLDKAIVAALVLAVGYFAVDKFVFSAAREAEIAETAREEGRLSAKLETQGSTAIAVLPFKNRSGDDSEEYFSDGVTEQIMNLLAQIDDMRVISRLSSFAYKGKNIPVPQIAAALKVGYVLDGSVRKSADGLRISVELIDAETDSLIWAENYNREIEDVFAIQDDIARQVTTAMKITLGTKLPTSAVTSAEAYELYLKGRKHSLEQTADGHAKALEYWDQSIALDPNYSLVWINRATLFAQQAARGQIPFDEGFVKAIESIDEAYRIDPDLASGVRGWIATMYERDYPAAARFFKRALAYRPGDGSIINNSAVFANVIGQTPRAIELVEQVAEIVPTSPIPHLNLASWHADIGNYDQARDHAAKAQEIAPNIFGIPAVLARIHIYEGNPAKALELLADETQPTFKEVVESIAYYELSDIQAADEILNRMIKEHSGDWAYFIAMVYAWRKDSDTAFEWLNRAIDENQNINALKTDAFFKNLYADPRWEQTLDRIGLSQSQVGAIQF